MPKIKDKKEASERHLIRLRSLAKHTGGPGPAEAEAFLLKLFDRRAALAGVKGEPLSGADVNSSFVKLLLNGTRKQQQRLAVAHASLSPEDLGDCFRAARHVFPAPEVFAMFSPYLAATADDKKEQPRLRLGGAA